MLSLVLAAAIGLMAVPASAAPPTVLIVPFDNATGDPTYGGLEHGIRDLLAAMLSRHAGRLRVVERERLDVLASERSLSWQQYAGERGAEAGGLAPAQYIVRGSFTLSNGRLEVQALLYETETTRLVTSAKAAGDANSPIQICDELAATLTKVPASTAAAPWTLPADDDPERSRLMIDGLGKFYTGQFHQAVPAFMKILARHPEDGSARYWLARSFYSAGLRGHAAIELRTFLRSSPGHVRAAEARALLETIQDGGDRR